MPIPRGRSLVLALLLGLALPLGAATSPGVEEPRAGLERWSSPVTPEHLAIAAVLRESRTSPATPAKDFVDRIAVAGPGLTEAAVDILARRRVPETRPEDEPQILSEPQRDLLLGALERQAAREVRASLESRLASAPDDAGVQLAAIHGIGAIGEAADLARLVELAPRRPGKERALTSDSRAGVRAACTSILRRDARAYSALADLIVRTDPQAGTALLAAFGGTRDPLALRVLLRAAQSQPELGGQAAALASQCGGSTEAALDREFSAWALSKLPSARPELARSLLQAMGALDDGSCVPAMIERLEDEDSGVRDSALWALRRLSGLGLPAEVGPWLTWYQDEVAWHGHERRGYRKDLSSRDPARVVEALRAYSERRTKRAELSVEVAKILAHDRPELRLLACDVLQRLGSTSSCRALATAMTDPDRKVAEAAWRALQAIAGRDLPRDPDRVRTVMRLL
jgi:HEAT repeats